MENEERIDIAVYVLNDIWSDIDFSSMSGTRKMKIWDEFSSKVRGCANSSITFEGFVEKMCKKFNILSLNIKDKMIDTVSNMPESDKKEIVAIYREKLMVVMLKLRILREEMKEFYSSQKKG